MLPDKNIHGIEKRFAGTTGYFFGTLALKMDNGNPWIIIIMVTGLLNTVAQVNVFAVHKKTFVKAPCDCQVLFSVSA